MTIQSLDNHWALDLIVTAYDFTTICHLHKIIQNKRFKWTFYKHTEQKRHSRAPKSSEKQVEP